MGPDHRLEGQFLPADAGRYGLQTVAVMGTANRQSPPLVQSFSQRIDHHSMMRTIGERCKPLGVVVGLDPRN
jgi:hypothetical protein